MNNNYVMLYREAHKFKERIYVVMKSMISELAPGSGVMETAVLDSLPRRRRHLKNVGIDSLVRKGTSR